MNKVSLRQKSALLSERWSQKMIGELNVQQIEDDASFEAFFVPSSI